MRDVVFTHQPPHEAEHHLSLFTDWDTDEPMHLVCDTCGIHWTIGPRIQGVPMGGPGMPPEAAPVLHLEEHDPNISPR
jgi:hypothetical protein